MHKYYIIVKQTKTDFQYILLMEIIIYVIDSQERVLQSLLTTDLKISLLKTFAAPDLI